MNLPLTIFEFIVLIFSAVLHEVAHGYVAQRLGDDTAERAGRLTLNPLKHLDPIGSVLMPVFLYLASGGSFFFAAAKPVPYNPNNLKDPRTGGALIAVAGPLTNFALALVFGLIVRVLTYTTVSPLFITLLALVCYVNILLGVFNLVPIPPLDGSRVLFAALPQTPATARAAYALERYGFFIVLIFVFFGFQLLVPIMTGIFSLLTGQSLG
ncbi:MAG TPA: site-2 protease family protein [Candidatus Paceibacterota bacterium]|nr:site-2 protease family protein [Candidatus Paceibacterota bacterium]